MHIVVQMVSHLQLRYMVRGCKIAIATDSQLLP